ncbi:hypothetical protein FIV34_04095 [Luteibacter pinisoli]|uniref:Uncharacterized protein n=1 Tax=Luteibacter pinisoli TaxID=2589080 RepID=A0A4Y5Z1S4_9GAMM|nr:hypothetical protein [Luteibacter pinisoli]QDE38438.1 hypothetical protein FIV34_04095 [Luteibacter pinisoli]
MIKNAGFGTRYATLATSLEQELASYDEWIDEVRSQLRAIGPGDAPNVREVRQRGADLLADLMRAREAIAKVASHTFEKRARASNVVYLRGHA